MDRKAARERRRLLTNARRFRERAKAALREAKALKRLAPARVKAARATVRERNREPILLTPPLIAFVRENPPEPPLPVHKAGWERRSTRVPIPVPRPGMVVSVGQRTLVWFRSERVPITTGYYGIILSTTGRLPGHAIVLCIFNTKSPAGGLYEIRFCDLRAVASDMRERVRDLHRQLLFERQHPRLANDSLDRSRVKKQQRVSGNETKDLSNGPLDKRTGTDGRSR